MNVPKDYHDRSVCIVGLGYVGLTLGVAMAEVGFEVYGVEREPAVLGALKRGQAHFSEAGLDARLKSQLAGGRLKASDHWPEPGDYRVYIITVGTPLTASQTTNISSIQVVSEKVAEILKPGDLVILRSTVRVGVSNAVVKPILDKARVPYGLAFCPERTLEGKALYELRTLPQIVGGVNDESAVRASQLFNFVTPTTIRVDGLETAEMIKLMNNTQRDLMFAFANEIAGICDIFQISAVDVIRAGNMGYARSWMPMPGPVGGPCLEKDAHILADGARAAGGEVRLSLLGRAINEELPAKVVSCVAELFRDVKIKKISIAGLAFKGRPETSDLRGTPAIEIISRLKNHFPHVQIHGFDPAVRAEDIASLGVAVAETAIDAFNETDCLIFQNNNIQFEQLDLSKMSYRMNKNAYIYDLWNQFDVQTLVLRPDVRYFGLGSRVYLSRP